MSKVRGRLLASAETVIAGLHAGIPPWYAETYAVDQQPDALAAHVKTGWLVAAVRNLAQAKVRNMPARPRIQYRFQEEARINQDQPAEMNIRGVAPYLLHLANQ